MPLKNFTSLPIIIILLRKSGIIRNTWKRILRIQLELHLMKVKTLLHLQLILEMLNT